VSSKEITRQQKLRLEKEKHKSLVVWLEKLDSMHTILTSQDSTDQLGQQDPFEADFKKLRDAIAEARDLIDERRELIQEAQSEYRADADQI